METHNDPKCIFISGHRNPDVDSIASAYALADLRRHYFPHTKIIPICPGVLPERAAFLFKRFGLETPEERHDVFLRIRDLMRPPAAIEAGTTLFDAVNRLRESATLRLPVVDSSGKYLGMLSSVALLSQLLNIGDNEGDGFTGRRIYSSVSLICRVLEAEVLSIRDAETEQDFDVYVAAMSPENFVRHVPVNQSEKLAIIVGGRTRIHACAVENKIRLLIITGSDAIDSSILEQAKRAGVSVIRTGLDSASVTRRLKFSIPVEHAELASEKNLVLAPDDRLRDFRKKMLRAPTELFPVVDSAGMLLGIVYKKQLSEPSPHSMILVDHNEPTQYLPGVEELPVVEVVDHHRISMFYSENPIRFTGDTVGSTCTLVAKMFRSENIGLAAPIAGLLLGGLISDTLLLKSPTTSPIDREICTWLESLCGVDAQTLMREMMQIESALTTKSATDVISGDRKDYHEGRYKFALAQVEETDLNLLHTRKHELIAQMKFRLEVESLSFFGLLVTDATHEISELLIVGDNDVVRALPHEKLEENIFSLPGVLSRKKQLLPQMLSICAALQRD